MYNDTFLRALRREPVDYTPIWVMRQAGRYLPEYREVRSAVPDFMALCKNPELACKVTLQPLDRFALDAGILFSDILTIPDAMGLNVRFVAGEGPQMDPLRDYKAIEQLPIIDPETELAYVMQAVRLIKHELRDRVPLIGFSGSPWTLATYMLEGHGSKQFQQAKRMLYDEPQSMHLLLSKLAQAVTLYLKAQIAAGVDAVMIFDTWGGLLTPADYQAFSLQYMQLIVESIGPDVPTILFTKGGGAWLEAQAATGCTALGLDWTVDIGDARQRVGQQVALQGNMDPALLAASPEKIKTAAQSIIQSYGPGSGHVFNLGHGITPDINPEHVQVLVDAVHACSQK